VRSLFALVAVLTLLIPDDLAGAQIACPIAVARRSVLTQQLSPATTIPASLRLEGDSARRPLWPWVLGGTVVGAAVGGIAVAASAAHSDDNFFPLLGVAFGVGLGAASGALLGLIVGGAVTAGGN